MVIPVSSVLEVFWTLEWPPDFMAKGMFWEWRTERMVEREVGEEGRRRQEGWREDC